MGLESRALRPPSVSFQPSKRNQKGIAIGGFHERLQGSAAPREASQAGKPGEVVCGGVGVSQQTENESHRLLVKGRVLEAVGMGGRGHRQTTEARYLGVWHSHPAADASRKNRFSFEEARHHLSSRFDKIRFLEELTESLEELRPLADSRRDQHH